MYTTDVCVGSLQSAASFVVPMFRATTEKSLNEQHSISDKERKYVVRTVATVLMSFNSQPRLSDCAVAGKALIAKYPFLGDTAGKPHMSRMCVHIHNPIFFLIAHLVFLDEVY